MQQSGKHIQHLPGIFFESYYATLTDSWNLKILLFIPIMMLMIQVILATGSLQYLLAALGSKLHGPRTVRLGTFFAGLAIFFDDYANSMIVGPTMRPLADARGISRSKLAFIVDATSAPVAGLAFVSTWVGHEIGLFNSVSSSLNLGKDGLAIFFDAIWFRFYCFFMLFFVFCNAWFSKDFGPMANAEERAREDYEAKGGVKEHALQTQEQEYTQIASKFLQTLMPLGVLIVFLFLGFWRDGHGELAWSMSGDSYFTWSAWKQALLQSENSVSVLLWAAIAGLITALMVLLLVKKRELAISIKGAFKQSWNISLVPLGILILAWVLKYYCDKIGLANHLLSLLPIQSIGAFFPAMVFALALLLAFATGTSWGTMSILIPTIAPLAYAIDGNAYGLMTMMSLAAVLDGAICGDHCSPISDTTIMSSTATSCDHLEHVRTQLPYAVFVGSISIFCGYIPVAFGLGNGWSLALGGAIILASQLRPAPKKRQSRMPKSFAFKA